VFQVEKCLPSLKLSPREKLFTGIEGYVTVDPQIRNFKSLVKMAGT
jgi:hypothetical protein